MHLRLCGWADIVFVCVRKTEMFACSCDKWQWLPFEQRYGRSGTPCRGNYYRLHRPEVPRQTRRKIENINDLWCSEVYLLLCLCCWPQSVRYAGTSFSVASCSCSSVINPFRHSGVEFSSPWKIDGLLERKGFRKVLAVCLKSRTNCSKGKLWPWLLSRLEISWFDISTSESWRCCLSF